MPRAEFGRETLCGTGVAPLDSTDFRHAMWRDGPAGEQTMSDILWLGLLGALLALTIGYARLCDGA